MHVAHGHVTGIGWQCDLGAAVQLGCRIRIRGVAVRFGSSQPD